MLKQFILILLQISSVSFADLNDEWSRLLQYDESFNANESYYLSKNKNPSQELYEYKDQLENRSNGFEYACKYPARYVVLKKYLQVPDYDLTKCYELNKYMRSIHCKYLDIVLTSEYFDSPASIFGHVMLLFHNEEVPEVDSTAFHFAAVTNSNDGFIKYIYNGIIGNYTGSYFREPFFKKVYEYSRVEQRKMHHYRLDVTNEQINFLLYQLYEIKELKYSYYFFKKNCAYYIARLLSTVLKNKISPIIYTMPIDIVTLFDKEIINERILIPDILKLKNIYNDLKSQEKETINSIIDSNYVDFDETKLSDKMKEWLVINYRYNFRKKHNTLNNYNYVSRLTYSSANEQRDYAKNNSKINNRKYPRKAGAHYRISSSSMDLSLTFRPAYLDLKDFQKDDMNESTLSLLEAKVRYKNKTSFLDELRVIDMLLLSDSTLYNKALSWSFYSGLNRKNLEYDLKYQNEISLGKTIEIMTAQHLSGLIGLGLNNTLYSIEPYIDPTVYFYGYISDVIKYGIKTSYKIGTKTKQMMSSTFINYYLGSRVALNLEYLMIKNISYAEVHGGVGYYF